MQISIADFKARNAEAQAINAEIQKAQGAIEENRRQFAKLCEEYEKQFGEHVDEKNLAEILARVTADVQAQAEVQALAIEKAKAGIVITDDSNEETVASTPSPTSTPVQASTPAPAAVQTPAPAPVTPPQTPVAPVQTNPFVAPPPVAPAAPVTPPPVAPAAPTQTNPFLTPAADGEAPKPFSAAALSAAAVKQANAASVPDMTQQISATQSTAEAAPTFPGVSIPGWNIPTGNSLDFNAMLGGAFGGGNK